MCHNKCDCCGAPLHGSTCAYCGTEFDISDLEIGIKRTTKQSIERFTEHDERKRGEQNDSLAVSVGDKDVISDEDTVDHFNFYVSLAVAVFLLVTAGLVFAIIKYGDTIDNAITSAFWDIPAFGRWQQFYCEGTKCIALLGMFFSGMTLLGALGEFFAVVSIGYTQLFSGSDELHEVKMHGLITSMTCLATGFLGQYIVGQLL